jgi:hypothetical protein
MAQSKYYEIVDLPINNGDFPVRYARLPEGKLNVFLLHQKL